MNPHLIQILTGIYSTNESAEEGGTYAMITILMAIATGLIVMTIVELFQKKDKANIIILTAFILGLSTFSFFAYKKFETSRAQTLAVYLFILKGEFAVDQIPMKDDHDLFFKISPVPKELGSKEILGQTVTIQATTPDGFFLTEQQATELQQAMLTSNDPQLRKNAQEFATK